MLKEREALRRHSGAMDDKRWHSTYSKTGKKDIITGTEWLASILPGFETCIRQESCVIMLSTTFSAGNGISEFFKVLKNMQQSGRSSAFASSWHMGAA
ncbi:MAG: hypothetical protein H0V70_18135 [Ktedonobacteraceae bacterium]|nr:hypothetical protein [Ktedonobacteraceae bacterium]